MYVYICIYFTLMGFHPDQLEGNGIRLFVLFVFVWMLCFLSVLICLASHVPTQGGSDENQTRSVTLIGKDIWSVGIFIPLRLYDQGPCQMGC